MLRDLFIFVMTHFAIGLVLTILFVSVKEIGTFFFRVTTFIAAILLILALIAHPFTDTIFTIGFGSAADFAQTSLIVSLTFLVLFNALLNRFHLPFLIMAGTAGLAGIVAYSIHLGIAQGLSVLGVWLLVLSSASATILLGSVLGAMITGHWYLVQHKLSIVPLKTSSRMYLIAVVLRAAVLTITVGITAATMANPEQIVSLFRLTGIGYVFWGRVLFGIIVPLIFAFMTLSAVKIHSTQSATGILYATIVLVLVGEVFGRVLFFWTGVSV